MTNKELTPEDQFLKKIWTVFDDSGIYLEGEILLPANAKDNIKNLLKEYAAKAVEEYKESLKKHAYNVEDQAGNKLIVIDIEDLLNQNPDK